MAPIYGRRVINEIPKAPCLTAEAARLLRVGEGTARRWADEGKLHVVRTAAGLRVYDRRELERVAAERAATKK